MKVVFHRGVLRDLAAIRAYIARDNPSAAAEVVDRIRKATDRLATLPQSGRPGPRGLRLLSVPGLPYIVIHRLRGDAVSVVAVFHTARKRQF